MRRFLVPLALCAGALLADGEYTANERELIRLFRIRQSTHELQVKACSPEAVALHNPAVDALCKNSIARLEKADKEARAFLAAHFPGKDPMLPNEVYRALYGHCYIPDAWYHDGWGGCRATPLPQK